MWMLNSWSQKKGLGFFMILIFFSLSFSPFRIFSLSSLFVSFFYIQFTTPYRSCVPGTVVFVCPRAFVCVQLLSVDPGRPAKWDFGFVSRLHVTSGGTRQSGRISNGPQHDGRYPSRHDPLQELNQSAQPLSQPITPPPPLGSPWNGKRKNFSTKG